MGLNRLLPATLSAVVIGCSTPAPQAPAPLTPPAEHSLEYGHLEMAAGQVVYVPVYSHVYQDRKKRPFNLVATLSVRNTDLEHPIRITSVRYYGSAGNLIRKFVEEPVTLAPLGSADYVVDEHEDSGSGTSFIVEWIAEQEVHEPVIESVMISTELSQGLSFTSSGRVIRTLPATSARE